MIFIFALRPGHLTSLISGANDVVRLEVADVTTGDILMDRTFQMADFHRARKGARFPKVSRSPPGDALDIVLSRASIGRGFPVFSCSAWNFFLGRCLAHVTLKQKASDFEDDDAALFPGPRVMSWSRDDDDRAEDTGRRGHLDRSLCRRRSAAL